MSPDLVERTAARHVWLTPKLAGFGVLVLVFLCGAIVGAVAINLGHTSLHQRPFWTANAKAEYLKNIQKELNLTPEQTAQMASILDDFAKYYQTVLSDGRARIMNILNDEQRRKFEKMIKQRQP